MCGIVGAIAQRHRVDGVEIKAFSLAGRWQTALDIAVKSGLMSHWKH